MSFDVLTYALLRKQIAQGGIQNIAFQDGHLVFTLADGSTHAIQLPTNAGPAYDPTTGTLTFQDGTTLTVQNGTLHLDDALTLQGGTLTFQDGTTLSVRNGTLYLNDKPQNVPPTLSQDGTALLFQDSAFVLPLATNAIQGSELRLTDNHGTTISVPLATNEIQDNVLTLRDNNGTSLAVPLTYIEQTESGPVLHDNRGAATPLQTSDLGLSVVEGKLCMTFS